VANGSIDREENQGMNDTERQQWVDNDESLYLWWKSSRQGVRQFIRDNREELDAVINRALGRDND
jgi:hypothetical protein